MSTPTRTLPAATQSRCEASRTKRLTSARGCDFLGPLTVYLSPQENTTYEWDSGRWVVYTGDGTPCSDTPYYGLEAYPPWAPPAHEVYEDLEADAL